ncbi:MAG: hypothetical protein AAF480_03985 [Actinomycetota bacterium]
MKRLIVSLCLVAIVGTACADVTQPAVEVNGDSIGRGEMLDLIQDLRPPLVPENPPVLDCTIRDTAVQVSIENALIREEIARLGGAVNDDDRTQASAQADQLLLGAAALFSEDGRPFIEETFGLRNALARLVTAEEGNSVLQRLFADADVTIDSRFGDWVDGSGFVALSPCA